MAEHQKDRDRNYTESHQKDRDRVYTEPHLGNAYQAYRILQFAFVVVPIVAGIDKFLYLLTNWNNYASPFLVNLFQGNTRVLFMIVGIIEIIAGILVAWKPQIFAYVVALWLLLIIINLLMMGRYYDIALRDFGLMLSAYALGRLSHLFDRHKVRRT